MIAGLVLIGPGASAEFAVRTRRMPTETRSDLN